MKTKAYQCKSKVGTFFIRLRNGRWHIMFRDENLGGYDTPQQALDDLIGGHSDFPSEGFDPSELGLPDDISDWEST